MICRLTDIVVLALRNMALAKSSGLPQTTVTDLVSGKADLLACSVSTVYRLSKALNMTMEDLIATSEQEKVSPRNSFDVFRSSLCHLVNSQGDIPFLQDILGSQQIRQLFEKRWYPEAFYLLAMVDYLSRVNNVPLCREFDDLREKRLKEPLYPKDVLLSEAVFKDESIPKEAAEKAIPEFKRFNLMEGDIRDVT